MRAPTPPRVLRSTPSGHKRPTSSQSHPLLAAISILQAGNLHFFCKPLPFNSELTAFRFISTREATPRTLCIRDAVHHEYHSTIPIRSAVHPESEQPRPIHRSSRGGLQSGESAITTFPSCLISQSYHPPSKFSEAILLQTTVRLVGYGTFNEARLNGRVQVVPHDGISITQAQSAHYFA